MVSLLLISWLIPVAFCSSMVTSLMSKAIFLACAAVLSCLLPSSVHADNETQPISIFRSRPDLVAPILTVFERKPELQAPGYYFISPYQNEQETVYIYDNDANLVYSGFGSAGPGISHAPQTCNYNNSTHLCFYQGTQMLGWGHGHGVIMDKHYRIVKSVEPSGSYQASSDMHEFCVLPSGKSALMTQYLRSAYDLSDYGIYMGLGYVNQGAFQEIDIETGEVLFEWRSLDHIAFADSYVPPSSTEISGTGLDPSSPWDYFHINSVDKNADGDYLISARHTSSVYKISGTTGEVLWRLNGENTDFTMLDGHFSFQHDARFVSDTPDETIISVFDNGSNGFNQTQPWSTALIIALDHNAHTARTLRVYDPPDYPGMGRHMAKSQGNFQQLPPHSPTKEGQETAEGNHILGWGNDAFWSEHTSSGEVVFYGSVGFANVMNYRVHKYDNWVGLPLTKPALWTYSKSQQIMTVYVSWNGATEVRSWKFYTSDTKSGQWIEATIIAKNGFETIAHLDTFAKYTYADALDQDGTVLGSSTIQETFVPSEMLRGYCDDLACKFVPHDEETREQIEAANSKQRTAEETQRNAPARRRKIVAGVSGGVGGFVLLVLLGFVVWKFGLVGWLRERVVGASGRGGKDRLGRYKAVMSPLPMDESTESLVGPTSWTTGTGNLSLVGEM